MKKFAVLLLSAVLALSTLTGCNKNKIDPNDPHKLEIYILDQGYGSDWCLKLLDAFKEEEWVKAKYPDLKTSFYKDQVDSTAGDKLAVNSRKGNKYDLLFGTNLTASLRPEANCLELTETVYNTDVPGEEGTKVKDKMVASALQAAQYNDGNPDKYAPKHYYMMNWYGGMMGIMYNKTQFENLRQGGEPVELPRTTDEFIDILEGITGDPQTITGWTPTGNDKQPFATYQPSTYIDYVSNIWWAQYDGVSGYEDFYYGRVRGGHVVTQSARVIKDAVGLLKTYEMLERFLPNGNITWNNPKGSSRDNFTDTQNSILLGNHLFMVTGDWVMNELRSFYDGLKAQNKNPDTVSMMPVPVLSSIIDKTPTINDDDTLSKVIKAIDEGKTFEECTADIPGVIKDDYSRIYEARHIAYTTGLNSSAFIPSYAAGFEPAQDFLRYMATDKAQEIFMETTQGCQLPFEYETEGNEEYQTLYDSFSDLNQAALKVLLDKDINFLLPESWFPLNRFGGFTIAKPIESRAEAIRTGTKPQGLIDQMYGNWDGSAFTDALNRVPKEWEE